MKLLRSVILLSVMLALGAVLLTWFASSRAERVVKRRAELSGTVDFDKLFDAIKVEHVRQTHERLVRAPTRLAGLPGDIEASQYVEQEFRRLGLEVVVQTFPVTVPVTKWCRIKVQSREKEIAGREGGGRAADPGLATRDWRLAPLSIHPFWPNHVRTCTTPPEGLVGEVIDVGTGGLEALDGMDIEGRIVLVTMAPNDEWLAAAKLGAKAVLFRESPDPLAYRDKILEFPGNLPRFLVRGPADQLVGRRVRIEARVDWQIRNARNVYGVLRPPKPSGEALVLTGFTDSWSVVPDLAPGSYNACSAAALLESARALVEQRHGLTRTAIFVAASGLNLGVEGPRRMLDAVGLSGDFDVNQALLKSRVVDARAEHRALERAIEAHAGVEYWRLDADGEAELWARAGPAARRAFTTVVERLIDRYVTAAEREHAAAKLAWVRAGRPDGGPAMEAQIKAMKRLRRAAQAAAADGPALKRYFPDVLEVCECRGQLGQTLADARSHARDALLYHESTQRAADLFKPFKKTYFFFLSPSTHGQQVRYQDVFNFSRHLEGTRDAIVKRWLRWGKSRVGKRKSRVRSPESRVPSRQPVSPLLDPRPVTRDPRLALPDSGLRTLESGLPPGRFMLNAGGTAGMITVPLEKFHKTIFYHMNLIYWYASHTSFMLVGVQVPNGYQTPLDTVVNHADLAAQTQLISALSLQILSDSEPMKGAEHSQWVPRRWFSDLGGEVVTAGGSNSILPNRRVPDALVVVRNPSGRYGLLQKTRDGVFRFPATTAEKLIDAYTIDPETGQLTGARNMGPDGQKFPNYINERQHFAEPETRITLLLSRLVPTDVFDLLGPHNQPLTLQVLDARFYAPPDEYAVAHHWEHGATIFARPGDRFFVALNSYPHYRNYGYELFTSWYGREGKQPKGILMGYGRESRVQSPESGVGQRQSRVAGIAPDRAPPTLDSGLWTLDSSPQGYLAGVDHRITFQEADMAGSVAALNRSRLAGQVRSGLADPVDVALAEKAEDRLESGLDALRRKQYTRAFRDLNASTALSIRAYPAIRTAVSDALNGILLYMFLLVPFSLFAERLLIGAGDIRGRIAGTFAIFLVAFGLIRLTHPAYDLIRSPMIVLVGFVIFMLCTLILSFISGKFAQRIGELRRAGDGAGEADSDISRSAAAATAFNLGINNMRKRKVRTAFTVSTLVLVSFCLVCFTAPRPQLLERQLVLGPAPYDGVMLRFERNLAGHVGAITTRFGHLARIFPRRSRRVWDWYAEYTPPDGQPRHSRIWGALWVRRDETMVTGIDKLLLPGGQWFERDDERVCYLSDVAAAELGIDARSVGERPVEILLAGWPIRVAGVFDSASLENLTDFDDVTLLPETKGLFTTWQQTRARTQQAAGRPGVKAVSTSYISSATMVILPYDVRLYSGESDLCTSIVLLFKDLPYGTIRETINDMMDSSLTFLSYALEGLGYFGGKYRLTGLEALVDMIVPLLIASFIVFNTMLGSVYERQKEISVYSAVGLSPRHVFYLFLAESLVYAVIGVVGGYLLALGLQWLSHGSGDLLKLNINHSSSSAIYVTVTLMMAVILSSLIPARQAARIASPSERVTWTLPPPTSPGRLEFDLPFTYVGRDILAVLPFITGWFDVRGEDSSAEFSASVPRIEVHTPEPSQRPEAKPVFAVEAKTWLRPYDLGISQRVRVSIRPSPRPSDPFYIACVEIRMLSGDEIFWRRTNAYFIGLLRRHLLSWRGVSGRRKEVFFDQSVARFGLRSS